MDENSIDADSIARTGTFPKEGRSEIEVLIELLIDHDRTELAHPLIEMLDAEHGDADLEPWLCGVSFGPGDSRDLEHEHDGREPEPIEDDRNF